MKIQFSSANPVPAPAAIPKAVGRIPWGHMSHTWRDKQKSDKIALDSKRLILKLKHCSKRAKSVLKANNRLQKLRIELGTLLTNYSS